MSTLSDPQTNQALEVFRPDPATLYTLEATAHLANVSRRSVLIYSRAGLLCPIFQPPYDLMVFTEESIHTIRRIEHLRAHHGMNVVWIKTVFDLFDEVDQLRAEVRFFRGR